MGAKTCRKSWCLQDIERSRVGVVDGTDTGTGAGRCEDDGWVDGCIAVAYCTGEHTYTSLVTEQLFECDGLGIWSDVLEEIELV